jgi:serine/threonine protein kinase
MPKVIYDIICREVEENDKKSTLLGNRYQLQQVLGAGGMAKVYLARDLMLERPVAIKVLKQDLSTNPAFRKRFQQEARAAANLSHPNIVTVHDFGFHHGRLYIVMEYVPGQDLKTILKQIGRLPVQDAIPLIIQACAGIGYAHRAGLVHCDVKPHNMIVTPDQRLKVTDFGIARALASIQPDEHYDVVWGSPQYFSPEQAAGSAPSPASDVYSLGVIFYEMLTGKLPFESEDPAELARLHREKTPTPPRQINPDIPESLDKIIQKVLSKEPSARYRTTDQLGRILETFMQQNQNAKHFMEGDRTHRSLFPDETPEIRPQEAIQRTPLPSRYQNPRRAIAATDDEIEEVASGIDWLTIGLGLITAIAVGGLIPFWIYVWFFINPARPIP